MRNHGVLHNFRNEFEDILCGKEMKIKEITSENNPTFKTFLRLKKSREIKSQGLALFSGPKQIGEVLNDYTNRCAGILLTENQQPPIHKKTNTISYYIFTPQLFRQLDFFDTGKPILLIRVPQFAHWHEKIRISGCVLCIPFQDPANVGAVIRSAAAFGVKSVILFQEAAHPYHPRSTRAAGSSLFRVDLYAGPSISEFNAYHFPMVTLSPKGVYIGTYRFPSSFYLIPGLEGRGLPEQLHRLPALSIPMMAGVESLNAATATGIALYLWRSNLQNRMVR